MLTAAEAGQALGLGHRTILKYIAEGHLPAIKQRKGLRYSWRIKKDDLVQFAEQHKIPINLPEN